MLHVQTAAKDHSVWRGLGEKTFMGNVESLVTPTGKVAGSVQIYKDRGLSTGNDRGSDYVLPFGAERQLANDFAFVAAAEASAKAVSAITITENVGGKGMIIRIAVNQTISPNVNNALRVMCHKLQQRSQGEIPFQSCVNNLFDTVIKVSRNRILGRLESKKCNMPDHRHSPRPSEPLTKRLLNLLCPFTRVVPIDHNCRIHDVVSRLGDLHNVFLEMENSNLAEEIDLIKRIVRQASDLSGSSTPLEYYLDAHNIEIPASSKKHLWSIDKVGRYWACCSAMAKMASNRRYRHVFGSVELEPLPSYCPHNSLGVARYVHAEVQLVTYYKLNPHFPPPRALGTSKAACYLCNLFLSHHPQYSTTATHGTVTTFWTVPDLAEYSSADLKRLRLILAAMNKEVVKRAKRRSRLPYAAQSRLWVPPYEPSPPATMSIASKPSSLSVSTVTATVDVPESLIQNTFRQQQNPPTAISAPFANQEEINGGANTSVRDSNIRLPLFDRVLNAMQPGRRYWVETDGMDLCFELEGSDSDLVKVAAGRSGKICIRNMPESEAPPVGPVVDVNSISPGGVMVLERQPTQEDVSMLLHNNGYSMVQVVCSWDP